MYFAAIYYLLWFHLTNHLLILVIHAYGQVIVYLYIPSQYIQYELEPDTDLVVYTWDTRYKGLA